MISQSRPMISMWFGNFFEPFFSDAQAVRRGIAEIAELGFNSINLDSKPWEDFFARYRGEPASPYVAMHELMMQQAAIHGLDYTHLALYLCGDNLYPTIRDVPPARGEEPILPNGKPMGTYKYWSPIAQQTMIDHVRGLLRLYGKGMRRAEDPPQSIVMQTMFEPIPKPSFDAEGKQRYLNWLQKRYGGDIDKLNQRYGLQAKYFTDLKPSEYWLRPDELTWVDCARPTADDFHNRTADFHRWIDNQSYLAEELETYMATMKQHWRELDTPLFIEPVLHQWGYFFNPPGHTMWQTGQRALDVYRQAPHVDGVLFIASPLNAENRSDAAALSVEASIMRCANAGRSFAGGLYLGRHVNGDLYRDVPPAEAIATLIAAGAKRLHVYGYSGLDDGGVLYRMDPLFKKSLRDGNRWTARVIPLIDQPRAKEAAILFPAEMSLFEPLEVDTAGRHRMDLLGWYQQFTDLGWHVDILHPQQVANGALSAYRHLIVPHNSLYDVGDNAALEAAVHRFVETGGTLLHGPHCTLAERAFNLTERAIDFDCIDWDEQVIPHGWSTVAYETGEPIARYIRFGSTAIARTRIGAGSIYSFGFQYGYSYSRRTMPIVPPAYGKLEMHPIILLARTPIEAVIGSSPLLPMPPIKGVEFARFGDHLIVVNHRSIAVEIGQIQSDLTLTAGPGVEGLLAGHSAVYIKLKRNGTR